MMKTCDTARAPFTTQRATEILKRVNIIGNPYFTDLCSGKMPLDVFRRSQQQFFFAVSFFPRPMAALVGRIPDPRQRLDILHNLVEEHGEFREESFHHNTFQRFLTTLGVGEREIEITVVSPAVRAFNSVLTTSCVMDEVEVGVGAMGIIEYAFAGISAAIGAAVIRNGWIPEEKLVHYKLHAEIDERHAEEFFAAIEPSWKTPERRYFVDQGLELGAYIFDRLYRDINVSCQCSPVENMCGR